ncbi:MAG: UDP-N-acetylmuramoyl-tripeptide--D-alanyl-D-alanine ligase [Candidatus Babeliales bacterium]|jgi:UDP-N-acetylmuramoyl-tripeptide--D-alanyl-D-alanine ligase
MKLTKDFLTNSLPYATFLFGDAPMTDADWCTYAHHPEVGVSFDTRTLAPGELFIPLPGTICDGHDFIEEALKRGASGSLIARERYACREKLSTEQKYKKLFIIVPDVQQALCDLATAWRAQLTCPVVGVTGSLGKTSTKEMVRSILEHAGITAYVSFKNYNNVLGVSYNVLRIPSSVAAAVLEMGINDVGEMRLLATIARPTMALITCVAHTHTEGLGNSLAAVAREKCEIFSFFTHDNVGIVPGDQAILAKRSYAHKTIYFGLRARNQIRARAVRVTTQDDGAFITEFNLWCGGDKAVVRMQGNHPSIVHNALAASAIAHFLRVPLSVIAAGLGAYRGTDGRFRIKKLKDNKGIVLDDCYNASPESMRAALCALTQFKAHGRKIAVLGDMLELGSNERRWHRAIGILIAKKSADIDRLVLVGKRARDIAAMIPSSLSCQCVDDWQAAAHAVNALLLEQSPAVVLVKASHGMQLDKLVRSLVEECR